MAGSHSVTQLIDQLKAGDQAAARPLWERYQRQILGLARKRLRGTPCRTADEEDVALSAFFDFCRGAERGQFDELLDRDDLEQLLLVITARKALRQMQHERRQKRGGGKPTEAALSTETGEGTDLEQIPGREFSPKFAAQVAEECQRLLDRLDDPQLRLIAVWKMEGDTTDEIAAKLQKAPRSIERKLRRIRGIWEQEITP
jgi:DNA-directed RNA polymerase specialized sigma24 family protein